MQTGKAVSDELLEEIQQFRKENMSTPCIEIARIFKVSNTTISSYTNHILRGEEKSIEDIRDSLRKKYYTKKCIVCDTPITIRALRCMSCTKRRRASGLSTPVASSRFIKKKITLDICSNAPEKNPYHHFILDVYNIGVCKNCNQRNDYGEIEHRGFDTYTSGSITDRFEINSLISRKIG